MTVYRWDGEQWAEVDGITSSSDDAFVRVKRADGWELVWPSHFTHVATSDGNWSDPATWSDGVVPTDGAYVLVEDGVEVTLSQVGTARVKDLRVRGTVRHDPTADSRLRVETAVVHSKGTYEMGTASAPIRPGVTAEVEFLDMGDHASTMLDDRRGKGLLVRGDVEIHGAEKTSWDTLSQHARAGDASITLDSAPTNWRPGDTVVVPDLSSYSSNGLDHDDEERTISSVSGNTVTFETPLEHEHVPPKRDLPSYATNLGRNARFLSESDDVDRFGHFMVMSPGQSIRYLETVDLGRTEKARDPTAPNWDRGTPEPASPPNRRARYSIHFHRSDPTGAAHVVEGCSVRGSPGWGVVNHGSNVECHDCVSYECLGAGFVAENGREVGHFKRNFALRSEGSGENTESRKGWSNADPNSFTGKVDDFGHSGHGFWIHSPLVAVEGNVAGGHRHTPITFWTRALHEEPLERDGNGNFAEFLDGKHDMFPKLRYELLTDRQKEWARTGDENPVVGDHQHDRDGSWVYGSSLPMHSFENNVAFGCGGGFDLRGGFGFRNQQSKLHRAVHAGNTSYNTGEMWLADGTGLEQEDFHSSGNVGLDHRYVGNLLGKDYRLVGTGDGIGVYNNSTYIDDFHVEGATIENWSVGLVPSHYTERSRTDVKDTTFANNDVDIELPGRFGFDGRVVADGNSYSGTTDLHWEEIGVPNMIPRRFTGTASGVRFEGRTVYHGWSRPNFVVVEQGDDERLDKMMNHGNDERWRELLDGDDPRSVLPSATHRELYEQYGITFYGGMQDPSAAGFERPATFSGSGGTYDSTPFLGPASKTQPTDEIWVDVVNEMSFSGDYSIVSYGDGVSFEEPISLANDGTVVELRRTDDRDWDLPVESRNGVASYDFAVDTPGTYEVHLRCQQGDENEGTGSNDNNSQFYTRVDGGTWKRQAGRNSGLAPTDDLVWPYNDKTSGNGIDGLVTKHDLSEGEHTIEIAGKGCAMRLDWALIKHETVAANPAGEGKAHTPRQ